jgi:hypothetical protein
VIGLLAAFCFVGTSVVQAARKNCYPNGPPPAADIVGSTGCGSATYSLSGNARFQIGDGLPIPIGGTPPPNGRVAVHPGATLRQTGVDPKTMNLTGGVQGFDGPPINLPVFLANPNVFQVNTNVSLGSAVSPVQPRGIFQAGLRTGAALVTFCAGQTATVIAGGNPGCTGPAGGPTTGGGNPSVEGLMRYTATKNQFGGPTTTGAVGGTADVAIRANAAAPCTIGNADCVVVMAIADPFPTGAVGNEFGFSNTTVGLAAANGLFRASITTAGSVIAVGTVFGDGVKNPVHEYGGPWTTGMLTVSQTAVAGPVDEIFVFSGYDNRLRGIGNISLVAGSVSDRALSGLNSNRGWLNYTIKPNPNLPTVGSHGLVALMGLMALAGAYALRRRLRSES